MMTAAVEISLRVRNIGVRSPVATELRLLKQVVAGPLPNACFSFRYRVSYRIGPKNLNWLAEMIAALY